MSETHDKRWQDARDEEERARMAAVNEIAKSAPEEVGKLVTRSIQIMCVAVSQCDAMGFATPPDSVIAAMIVADRVDALIRQTHDCAESISNRLRCMEISLDNIEKRIPVES